MTGFFFQGFIRSPSPFSVGTYFIHYSPCIILKLVNESTLKYSGVSLGNCHLRYKETGYASPRSFHLAGKSRAILHPRTKRLEFCVSVYRRFEASDLALCTPWSRNNRKITNHSKAFDLRPEMLTDFLPGIFTPFKPHIHDTDLYSNLILTTAQQQQSSKADSPMVASQGSNYCFKSKGRLVPLQQANSILNKNSSSTPSRTHYLPAGLLPRAQQNLLPVWASR